jgi:dihydroflavonol-4-reductase
VQALLSAGYAVRALCRSEEPGLVALGAEVVRGDVMDPVSVATALKGVAVVVHGAGLVSREPGDGSLMHQLHVTGTRHVVSLAIDAGVRRVVHLSTSGTVGVGLDPAMVYREDDPVPFEALTKFPYYLSKWLGERAAEDAIASTQGGKHKTELITLSPSLALGPGDTRGSSTTDVRRFLNREIPIVPAGGFSFVDARDVAITTVAALEQGTPGERYLLGALNLTFAQFFDRLSQVSGVRGPPLAVPVPRALSLLSVGLLERVVGVVGGKLPVTTTEAEMAAHFWYIDSRKAERALGFSARDPMETLRDTVRDIRGKKVA